MPMLGRAGAIEPARGHGEMDTGREARKGAPGEEFRADFDGG
jgi:hypothetical protein